MNRFVAAIAIASTLVLVPGCSSFLQKSGALVNPTSQAEGSVSGGHSPDHNSSQIESHHMDGNHHTSAPSSMSDAHGDHSHGTHGTTAATTLAKLTVPPAIAPNSPVSLAIDIQDTAGKAVSKFETFQEQQMHLIIVSDDLQFFNHLHPAYKENGRFEVESSFPLAGNYSLFADYKPAEEAERVSVLKTTVTGDKAATPEIDFARSKALGNTAVNLNLSQEAIAAGEEVMVTFDLKDAATQKAVTDLQPYLGETGHLVIIKQSGSPTEADYIHAHALPNAPTGQVQFMTQFPQPGDYKMWGQFNRNGEIVTADFWVNVR